MPRAVQSWIKCVPLSEDSLKRDAVIRHDPDRIALQTRESRNQCRAIIPLEFAEAAVIRQARDDLANVVGLAETGGQDTVDFLRIVTRGDGFIRWRWSGREVQAGDDIAQDLQRVFVILREMVGDTGSMRMQICAAQLLHADILASGRFYQRWPTQGRCCPVP